MFGNASVEKVCPGSCWGFRVGYYPRQIFYVRSWLGVPATYSGINLDPEPGSGVGTPFFMETIFHSLASLGHWDNLCVSLSHMALSCSVPGFTQGDTHFWLPTSFGPKVVAPVCVL